MSATSQPRTEADARRRPLGSCFRAPTALLRYRTTCSSVVRVPPSKHSTHALSQLGSLEAANEGSASSDNEALVIACVQWLRDAGEGDAKAFEQFYRATFRFAQTVARRIVGSAFLDDVLAETYIQAWRQVHSFDVLRGNPVAWIVTIARSRALDRLRQEQVRHGGYDGAIDVDPSDIESDTDIDAETLLSHLQTQCALREAMAQLSPNERWCLGLAYYRDMTHSEISIATDLPLGTVKSLISRSQQKLRAALTLHSATPSNEGGLQ